MGFYRKISTRIWFDNGFRQLTSCEKIMVICLITHNMAPPEFKDFVGPEYTEADENSHRPELSTAKWRKVRAEIISERGAVCEYCGTDCSDYPTIDHIKAASRGGTSEKDNLVVACKPCNSRKGAKEDWVHE